MWTALKTITSPSKKRGRISFLRRIVWGPADDSYGIESPNGRSAGGRDQACTRRAPAEATAPGASKAMQLDFETVEAYNNPAVPEVVDKLNSLDIET